MKPLISIPVKDKWVPLNTLSPEKQIEIRKKIAQVLENAIRIQIESKIETKITPKT